MNDPSPILVVDDDPLMCWSLCEHLATLGRPVLCARSAGEARKLLGEGVGLLVLDWRLPDTVGVGLLREARAAGLGCPILVISAHLAPGDVAVLEAAGATAVVEKPFELAALRELVRDALALASAELRGRGP